VVEETPAPGLRPEVRDAMCQAAVRLARESGYNNAGTCEFLVDKNQNYYFIEVNARLQVEHPITEMVTGVDLVKWQIRIAAGEKLPFRQEDIKNVGAAIECRINAEDPAANFRPSPGKITVWRPPGGLGVRLDTHVSAGYSVPANYDSMIAKLIVYKPTRTEAIACMRRALDEFHVEGIKTIIPLHREIFNHTSFIEGQVDTTFIERNLLSR
jgi:acetyl-CoA carboxylase biotin carboxylase subunit